MPSAPETLPNVPAEQTSTAQAARRVIRLPDSRFFVRTIAVAPEATAAEVASQVELALEACSPFPVAQLYHGHFWLPGESQALVYAAYRRRFTADETDAWRDADLVMPEFASVLGLKPETGSTVLISTENGITGVHWGSVGTVPSRILAEPVSSEASEEVRMAVREGMVRALGGSLRVIELTAPVPLAAGDDPDARDYDFVVGEGHATLPAAVLDAVDVRDKGDLVSLRKSRSRDLLLWRMLLGLVALVLLAGALEIALVGLKFWQKARVQRVEAQRGEVEQVISNDTLTRRIAQLSETLRPFEMIGLANDKPESVYFLSTEARDVNVLIIEATTRNSADIGTYEATLRANPNFESVEMTPPAERDGVSTFRITLKFKPEAFRAGGSKP